MWYLLIPNSNDSDVTLYRFTYLYSAVQYVEDWEIREFMLGNILDQTNTIFGYPADDYEQVGK